MKIGRYTIYIMMDNGGLLIAIRDSEYTVQQLHDADMLGEVPFKRVAYTKGHELLFRNLATSYEKTFSKFCNSIVVGSDSRACMYLYENGDVIIANVREGDYVRPGYINVKGLSPVRRRVNDVLEVIGFRVGAVSSAVCSSYKVKPLDDSILINKDRRKGKSWISNRNAGLHRFYKPSVQNNICYGWKVIPFKLGPDGEVEMCNPDEWRNIQYATCYLDVTGHSDEQSSLRRVDRFCLNSDGEVLPIGTVYIQKIPSSVANGLTHFRIKVRNLLQAKFNGEPMVCENEDEGIWSWEGEPITKNTSIELYSLNARVFPVQELD